MSSPEKHGHSTIITGHRYKDAPAAIEWLCKVFGFERHAVYEGPDGTIGHAELTLGGGMIMLGSGKDDEFGRGFKGPDELGGIETRSVYIVVPWMQSMRGRWLREAESCARCRTRRMGAGSLA